MDETSGSCEAVNKSLARIVRDQRDDTAANAQNSGFTGISKRTKFWIGAEFSEPVRVRCLMTNISIHERIDEQNSSPDVS